jgi:hypothetical protein
MNSASVRRMLLFFGGLAAMVASYAMQVDFPADPTIEPPPQPAPAPAVPALLAIGGLAAVAASLLGRRKK